MFGFKMSPEFAEKLYAAGGIAQGDNSAAEAFYQRREAERLRKEQQDALAPLFQAMQGGQPQQAPQVPGQEMEGPMPSTPGGPPTVQSMMPALAGAAGKGANINPWLSLIQASQPKARQTIEGPDGIYEQADDGWRKVQAYPAKERTAPSGFQWIGDKLQVIPGYAEGMGQITGQRRDAVVSRPMPGRGGGGRGGGSVPALPPGFVMEK